VTRQLTGASFGLCMESILFIHPVPNYLEIVLILFRVFSFLFPLFFSSFFPVFFMLTPLYSVPLHPLPFVAFEFMAIIFLWLQHPKNSKFELY
jgi:hypothetical protein